MITKEFEVVPVLTKAYCDECSGELKYSGGTSISDPTEFPHICIECGATESLKDVYPTINFKEVTND